MATENGQAPEPDEEPPDGVPAQAENPDDNEPEGIGAGPPYLTRLSRYLDQRGVPLERARRLYAPMGKRAAALYQAYYGIAPPKIRRRFNGASANGYGYPREALFILDRAFDESAGPHDLEFEE